MLGNMGRQDVVQRDSSESPERAKIQLKVVLLLVKKFHPTWDVTDRFEPRKGNCPMLGLAQVQSGLAFFYV